MTGLCDAAAAAIVVVAAVTGAFVPVMVAAAVVAELSDVVLAVELSVRGRPGELAWSRRVRVAKVFPESR